MARKFPNKIAVLATGCTTRQLQDWRQRNVIEAIGEMNETGRALYTRDDLIKLRIMAELVAWGCPPAMANLIGEHTVDDILTEHPEFLRPSGEHVVALVWHKRVKAGDVVYSGEWTVETYRQSDFGRALSRGTKAADASGAIFLPISDMVAKIDTVIQADF